MANNPFRIQLDRDDFERLVSGKIVTKSISGASNSSVEISLADIGFDNMIETIIDKQITASFGYDDHNN